MTSKYNSRRYVLVNGVPYDPGEMVRATCIIFMGLAWERVNMRFAGILFIGLLALISVSHFDGPMNLADQIRVGIAAIVTAGGAAVMVQLAYKSGLWRMETAIKRGQATPLK